MVEGGERGVTISRNIYYFKWGNLFFVLSQPEVTPLLHPLQNDLRGASLQRITAATGAAGIGCLRVACRLGQVRRQRCGRIGNTIVTAGHRGGQCTLWLLGHSDHAGRQRGGGAIIAARRALQHRRGRHDKWPSSLLHWRLLQHRRFAYGLLQQRIHIDCRPSDQRNASS